MTSVATPDRTQEIRQQAAIRLERKHPLAIRWMHWINFPVLFLMVLSGIRLYWNTTDNAHLHAHAVYRIGFGSWTLIPMFPEPVWNALHIPWHVTEGLGDHLFFFWIFAMNGLAYVLFLAISGEWRFLMPRRESLKEALQVMWAALLFRRKPATNSKYNAAQRIAYSATILMGAGSLITGLAIWKPTQAHLVTSLLGGYEWARWEHFWLAMGFCAFFLVHVVQVIFAGWNNFRGMISGYEIRPASTPSIEAERKAWR
jgi:thiosulfate reductase cytochrome b subunit